MLTNIITKGISGIIIEESYEFQTPVVNLDGLGRTTITYHPMGFKTEQFYEDDNRLDGPLH